MRVGGSRLNSHTNQHNKLCVVCKEIETNEHYLLQCKKYNQERVKMSTKIKTQCHLDKLRWNMTVDKMLGIFEESYKYIIKKKQNEVQYIVTKVCEYIENTKRFKEKQPEFNVNDISDDEKIAEEIE